MNFVELDAYLLSKKGAIFDYPFDKTVRVYRMSLFTINLPKNKKSYSVDKNKRIFYG